MNQQQEQHLADELEQLIQAAQTGKQAPTTEISQDEANLAARLVDLAQHTEASPAFAADLRARLRKRANQIQSNSTTQKKASFWQELSRMLTGDNTMKRGLALGAILLLIVFVGAAVFSSGIFDTGTQVADVTPLPIATLPEEGELPTNPEETLTETDNPTETPEEIIQPTPAEELALLPRFEAQMPGMGGGGGGDGTASAEADAPMPIEGDFDLKMMNPFSGTTFILNGTLPLEPVSGFVQQRQPEVELTPEQAREIANQYGFTGPLYVETYSSDVSADIPPVYVVFDGPRNLRLDSWAINYADEAAVAGFDYENPSLTIRPEIVAVAEAFLTQRGQLNFPYVAEAQLGDTVAFYRLIDGRKVNEAELSVSVNPNNEVAYVWDNTSTEWTAVGNYPLITAEQAWQKVLGGVFENNIQYWMLPADLGDPGMVEPPVISEDEYQYWPRTFTAGNEVHFYEWPQVYRPVDGGTPLLKVRQYTLAADDATLNAIAEVRDQQIHLWGTLNADNTMTVAGWEPLGQYEPIFQQGAVSREGDQLVFTGLEGDTYILPDAPADIEDGLEVNVFGYGVRDVGLAYPVLDWESIDKYIEYPEPGIEEPMPIEPGIGDTVVEPFEPFHYEQAQIDSADLVYFITYVFPEAPEGEELMMMRAAPTIYLQPAWAFAGTADNGDTITLFVQAVDEAYLQQP